MADVGSYNSKIKTIEGVLYNGVEKIAEESGVALIVDESTSGLILNNRVTANYGTPGYLSVSLVFSDDETGVMGAGGEYSFAQGNNVKSTGYASFATGYLAEATGHFSIAMGYEVSATAYSSVALGTQNTVSGNYGFAAGRNHDVSHFYGAAIGDALISKSASAVVVGQANTDYTILNPGGNNQSDQPMLIVGNGSITSDSNNTAVTRSDALVAYYSGAIVAPSLTTALIDAGGNKGLVTKEWVMANFTAI